MGVLGCTRLSKDGYKWGRQWVFIDFHHLLKMQPIKFRITENYIKFGSNNILGQVSLVGPLEASNLHWCRKILVKIQSCQHSRNWLVGRRKFQKMTQFCLPIGRIDYLIGLPHVALRAPMLWQSVLWKCMQHSTNALWIVHASPMLLAQSPCFTKPLLKHFEFCQSSHASQSQQPIELHLVSRQAYKLQRLAIAHLRSLQPPSARISHTPHGTC